ncbi:MAG: DUF4249 family protein [Kiritimatiellae bacterium]|jgi:hypothetical protein|nr:DUF4249 family protein [Kiritimatiellia bacterium]
MKHAFIILIALGILLSSCRELVQDEFPEFENTVTVNTIIAAGDSVKVYLAYTDELNENPLETIENAEITMSNQNWDNISFTHQGDGMFISDYIAQINDSLHLTVSVPGEDVVTSSCVVPQPIEIQYANVEPYGWVDDEGVASPLVHVKIKNDPNREMYGVVYARIYFKTPCYVESPDYYEDPYYLDTCYSLAEDYEVIGTIDNINETGEFLEKEFGRIRSTYYSSMISMAFQVKLRTVDYNYYTYLSSIGAYEVGRNPNFTNTYIMPVNLYSNIEYGYGIMCSYSEYETDTIF